MKKRKIIGVLGLCLISAIGYYLYPIQNKNNIANPHFRTFMTERPPFKNWRIQFDLLSKGYCVQTLWKIFQKLAYHEHKFWLARMLSRGVCLPKSPELAYSLFNLEPRNLMYHRDLLHLGYLSEVGIGQDANLEFALESYKLVFIRDNDLNEEDYHWITNEYRYLFNGQQGTELLRLAFEEVYADQATND